MTLRFPILTVLSLLVAASMSAPAHLHGQQPTSAQDHEQHHPITTPQSTPAAVDQRATMMSMMATMRATDQKLDDLVKKMNAAQGNAKVDAIAELLTNLVQDRKTMHESMSNMSIMMNMTGPMNAMHGRGDGDATPKK
jgi:hypothetical protein